MTFEFENPNSEELDLIIGYDCVDCIEKKEYSKNSDINDSVEIFKNIKKVMSKINVQNENIENSSRETMVKVMQNNSKHYKWTIFEFIIIIFIYSIQIYFIFSYNNKNILI